MVAVAPEVERAGGAQLASWYPASSIPAKRLRLQSGPHASSSLASEEKPTQVCQAMSPTDPERSVSGEYLA